MFPGLLTSPSAQEAWKTPTCYGGRRDPNRYGASQSVQQPTPLETYLPNPDRWTTSEASVNCVRKRSDAEPTEMADLIAKVWHDCEEKIAKVNEHLDDLRRQVALQNQELQSQQQVLSDSLEQRLPHVAETMSSASFVSEGLEDRCPPWCAYGPSASPLFGRSSRGASDRFKQYGPIKSLRKRKALKRDPVTAGLTARPRRSSWLPAMSMSPGHSRIESSCDDDDASESEQEEECSVTDEAPTCATSVTTTASDMMRASSKCSSVLVIGPPAPVTTEMFALDGISDHQCPIEIACPIPAMCLAASPLSDVELQMQALLLEVAMLRDRTTFLEDCISDHETVEELEVPRLPPQSHSGRESDAGSSDTAARLTEASSGLHQPSQVTSSCELTSFSEAATEAPTVVSPNFVQRAAQRRNAVDKLQLRHPGAFNLTPLSPLRHPGALRRSGSSDSIF